LDFGPGAASFAAGAPRLVYNSDTVAVHPVIEASLTTDPAGEVPASLDVQLTWAGQDQPGVNLPVMAQPGDTLFFAVQEARAVAQSGVYAWKLTVTAHFASGDPDQVASVTGLAQVVANDQSLFGAGWNLNLLSRLVVGAGGVLLAYG